MTKNTNKRKKTKKYKLCECLNCGELFIPKYNASKNMFCSYKCSATDEFSIFIKQEKVKKTVKEKYGVDSAAAIPSVKAARDKALIENAEEINEKRRSWWSEENIEKVNATRVETVSERYGVEYVSQVKEIRERAEQNCLEKYGVKYGVEILDDNGLRRVKNSFYEKYGVYHTMQVEEIKDKAKSTAREHYGVDYYLASNERRIQCNYYSLDDLDQYKKYRHTVAKITYKNKKKLFESWDGLCYYTKVALIIDTSKYNNRLYATIDHKYPVSLGFLNNIPPDEIGGLDNLCICARYVNTKKQRILEEEFKQIIQNNPELAN